MFDPSGPLRTGTKGTVPMTAHRKRKQTEQARPKGKIVGKDQARKGYHGLLALADGRTLVGYRGPYIDSPFGLQIRAGDDLAVEAELPGAAGPFSLRGDNLLSSGPLCEGYQSSVHVVDLTTRSIRDTFPLCRPYLWLPESRRFVGQTPSFPSFKDRPHVDPALLDRHAALRRWIEGDHARRLLVVGENGDVEATLAAAEVGPEYPVFVDLALSPDGGTLYAATERSVAALAVADWSLRWRVALGGNRGARFLALYALALSPDGRSLAAGGLAGHGNTSRALTVLDTATGEVMSMGQGVGRALGSTAVHSLAWHPGGWLACGAASGSVALVDGGGNVRRWKGAGKAIESLLFLDAGRSLLVCGTEAFFRVWPLLEDEAGGRG